MARTGVFKQDGAARELLASAYDAIPKSVFAVMAYYLAEQCAGVGQDKEISQMVHELECLAGQVIDPKQAARAIKALRETFPVSSVTA